MIKTKTLLALVVLVVAGVSDRAECQSASKVDLSYENHNQVDYGPLAVQELKGIVVDSQQVSIPGAAVILFSGGEHKLLRHTNSDSNGKFHLSWDRAGLYRLVVKYGVFCPANVPINLRKVSKTKAKSTLVVQMKPRGLDSCSVGEIK